VPRHAIDRHGLGAGGLGAGVGVGVGGGGGGGRAEAVDGGVEGRLADQVAVGREDEDVAAVAPDGHQGVGHGRQLVGALGVGAHGAPRRLPRVEVVDGRDAAGDLEDGEGSEELAPVPLVPARAEAGSGCSPAAARPRSARGPVDPRAAPGLSARVRPTLPPCA